MTPATHLVGARKGGTSTSTLPLILELIKHQPELAARLLIVDVDHKPARRP